MVKTNMHKNVQNKDLGDFLAGYNVLEFVYHDPSNVPGVHPSVQHSLAKEVVQLRAYQIYDAWNSGGAAPPPLSCTPFLLNSSIVIVDLNSHVKSSPRKFPGVDGWEIPGAPNDHHQSPVVAMVQKFVYPSKKCSFSPAKMMIELGIRLGRPTMSTPASTGSRLADKLSIDQT